MEPVAYGSPDQRPSGRLGRGAILALLVALTLTFVALAPRVMALVSGESANPVPTRSVGSAARTPVPGEPEISEAVFPPGSEAAHAFEATVALAEADIAGLGALPNVDSVGRQRVLECPPDATTPDDWRSCLVVAYVYTAWDGDFTSIHDEIVRRLSDNCSFAGTDHIDWTPPQNNARQQQGGCPGRPNVSVHWASAHFFGGVRGCAHAWHDSCAPTSSEITGLLDRHDWQGRVWLSYPLDQAGWAAANPTAKPTPAPTTVDGRPTADAVLDGDVAADARQAALDRAAADTRRLTGIPGVTLAGTMRGMGCHELNNHDKNEPGLRLSCAVWTRQHLAWKGSFAEGRQKIITQLSRWCSTKNLPAKGRVPSSTTSAIVELPTCPESPFLYVDWAVPAYHYAVFDCTPSPRNTCGTANAEKIRARLAHADWVATVTIDYQFYKDMK